VLTAPERPGGPSIALALGGGGARGLAHIAVLEAFDEIGIKPAVIAGASIGAVIGAAYAAGISSSALRAHALDLLRDRASLMAALIGARVGRLTDMLAGFGNPLLIDGERLLDRLWPDPVPGRFEALQLPFIAVATDYYGKVECVMSDGPLLPAVAASMAIPGLMRPVRHRDRLLVDGGAVNPLPFDHLIGRADLTVAADVTGGPIPHPTRIPAGFEVMFGTLQIMQGAIVAAKLKNYRPAIVVRPAVDRFRVLDFFEARAILAAAQPVKDELKRELERHFERPALSHGERTDSAAAERGEGRLADE
jgi:NTE family protein